MPYEAAFGFSEVQGESQILPHLLPVALVLILTKGVNLGKSSPSLGLSFPLEYTRARPAPLQVPFEP